MDIRSARKSQYHAAYTPDLEARATQDLGQGILAQCEFTVVTGNDNNVLYMYKGECLWFNRVAVPAGAEVTDAHRGQPGWGS
jgi:hypothetical protein